MKFTPSQQHEFDLLIGQAAQAWQQGNPARALEQLEAAHLQLVSLEIHDDYDWSGWYDLKLEVLKTQGADEEAASTAQKMLEHVDPEPSDFSEEHHRIIQDSLINAARVRAKYLITQHRTESIESELRRTLEAGITLAYRQEREEAFEELQQLHTKAFARPYDVPDEQSWEDMEGNTKG